MTRQSPQDREKHIKNSLPGSLGESAPSHPPQLHEEARNFPSPPLHPYPMGFHESAKTSANIVNIGGLSLFAIASSLIFFGAFTFLGGLLLGMWCERPQISPYLMEKPQRYASSSSDESVSSSRIASKKEEGGKTEGSSEGSEVADKVGDVVSDAVSDKVGDIVSDKAKEAGLPDFLNPLILGAQDAVGKQAGYKAQQATEAAQDSLSSSSIPEDKSYAPKSTQNERTSQTSFSQPSVSQVQEPQRQHQVPVIQVQDTVTTPPSVQSFNQGQSFAPEEQGTYTIQLGVYAARENAEALKNHLQRMNYTTAITEGKSPDGNPLYYVHSGSYKDYSIALEAVAQLASQNMPGAVIVKLSQNRKDVL